MQSEPKRLSNWEIELENLFNVSRSARLGSLSQQLVIRCYESVTSTMDLARENLALVSDEEPLLILAKNQTKGRGRQGRVWNAADEGFYGTYAFKTNLAVQSLTGLSLAVGCVLCDCLKLYTTEIGLKWPNDVLSKAGEKLCGVLIELFQSQNQQYVLVGIGINLLGKPELINETSSLFDLSGKVISPVELAGIISPKLIDAWSLFIEKGFSEFKNRWQDDALFLGKQFSVSFSDSPNSNQNISGTFVGVDKTGALLLENSEGKITITAGHILSIS